MKKNHQQGLYNPLNEHDACGVGMLVNIHGAKSHSLVSSALTVLENMRHRGAEGADQKTGDGAGIMIQIPHEFILLQGIPVPEKGRYGTGLVFMPQNEDSQKEILAVMIKQAESMGLDIMHVRAVPVNSEILGRDARAVEPAIRQIFVTGGQDQNELEQKLFFLRKKIEKEISASQIEGAGDFYVCSLSTRRIVYKGMLETMQLRHYFPDLTNDYLTSGLALVHSRFSTNTFPTWSLAQPFRFLAHNGEINTVRGNRAWTAAREEAFCPVDMQYRDAVRPIIQEGMSDSASLDNILEFLLARGLSLPHAMAMLVPESFNEKNPISEDLKAFYEYNSILMEAWDGPAALLFSDGRYAGGMLDRNGLRPARYLITKGGVMMVASEVGVMDFPAEEIVEKGRLQPGKIIMVDTEEGRIYYDGELKKQLADAHPYRAWLSTHRVELDELKTGRHSRHDVDSFAEKLHAFGYSREDVERILVPMSTTSAEPVASMGNDTPLAVLSSQVQPLYNYFRQQFAQVTNPPIDPLREELVMSLSEYIGAVGHDILTADESHCKMVHLKHPVLTNTQVDLLCNIRYKGFKSVKIDMIFPADGGVDGLKKAIDDMCHQAEKAIDEGANYIILSDRAVDEHHAAIPSLLAVSAVHHYLVGVQKRVQTALVVETGDAREVMHCALLLGYGASAINPYMAFAVLKDLVDKKEIQLDYATAQKNYIKALCKGLLKIISKMGISTIRSYRGAQLFEAIGLSEELVRDYFCGTTSNIGGIRLQEIAKDVLKLHSEAYQPLDSMLPHHGLYSYRKDGEAHAWNPESITALQLSTRLGSYKKFKEYTHGVDEKEQPIFLRDFLGFKKGTPIALEEVEPVESIMKRFVTGAMDRSQLDEIRHKVETGRKLLALEQEKLEELRRRLQRMED
ncbi:MAG: glutamate synthase central domain-containing protein, partial [Flavobacteriales bacterium]|nr:glutamate synthase central domain-containing protein [Flavobacteriales bacterium]